MFYYLWDGSQKHFIHLQVQINCELSELIIKFLHLKKVCPTLGKRVVEESLAGLKTSTDIS